jgi:hypothetical protein
VAIHLCSEQSAACGHRHDRGPTMKGKAEAAGHSGRPLAPQCESAACQQARGAGTECAVEEMAGYEHGLIPRR